MTDINLVGVAPENFGTRSDFNPMSPMHKLGPRAFDVLRHVACGLTNPDIATAMSISEATVVNHLTSIYSKLGIPENRNARVIATLLMVRDCGKSVFD